MRFTEKVIRDRYSYNFNLLWHETTQVRNHKGTTRKGDTEVYNIFSNRGIPPPVAGSF